MASPVTKDDTSSTTAPTGATRATTDSAEGRSVSTFPSTQVYSTDKNNDKSTYASSLVLNAIPKIHSKDGVPRLPQKVKIRKATKKAGKLGLVSQIKRQLEGMSQARTRMDDWFAVNILPKVMDKERSVELRLCMLKEWYSWVTTAEGEEMEGTTHPSQNP
nr:hypothetical protein L204_05075 [Cryptococcus depauperatus CBS 7855]